MYSLKAPKQNQATYTNISNLFCTIDLGPLVVRTPILGTVTIDVTTTTAGITFLRQFPTYYTPEFFFQKFSWNLNMSKLLERFVEISFLRRYIKNNHHISIE